MHTNTEPENDIMTAFHWLFVAAGIASLLATLLGPPVFWLTLLLCVVAFACLRVTVGKKRQYAQCFLLGAGLAFMGLFAALMLADGRAST